MKLEAAFFNQMTSPEGTRTMFLKTAGGDEGLPVTVLTIQTADPEVIEALRHGATYSIELVEIGEPSLTPPLEEQA